MSAFIWDDCQLTYDGYQFNELHEGYGISLPREGSASATRKISCAWGDAVALATSLKGNSVEVNGTLLYTDAASHPELPFLKVSNVNISPKGQPLTTGVWEQAHLDVSYNVPEFGQGSETEDNELKEESLDISAFNQQVTAKDVKFAGGDAVEQDIYVTQRVIEYRATLYRQATLPLGAIAGLVNKVNNATWEGVPAGYALYGGAEANRVITESGAQEWTISHVVFIGDKDLRQRKNPNGGDEEILFKNGDPLYEAGSFTSVGI